MTLSLFDSQGFSANLFYPRRDMRPAPSDAHDLLIEVEPRIHLHARIHRARASIATVLLFHGNGETVPDYDGFAGSFQQAGADLLVVDYRGYGRSEGQPSLRACLSDAHRVVLAALSEGGSDKASLPLIVMGRSLGSACAAELYRQQPPVACGFIFESGFTDLASFARRRGMKIDGPLPEEDLAAFCPLRKLRTGGAPLLVLHGACDELISPADAQAAFDSAGTVDKRLVLVPDAGHNDLVFHPLYWQSMAHFVAHVAR